LIIIVIINYHNIKCISIMFQNRLTKCLHFTDMKFRGVLWYLSNINKIFAQVWNWSSYNHTVITLSHDTTHDITVMNPDFLVPETAGESLRLPVPIESSNEFGMLRQIYWPFCVLGRSSRFTAISAVAQNRRRLNYDDDSVLT